jgi:antitoxin (DNA-binding transcriptional repressor) of toxin-antitoxin stability system
MQTLTVTKARANLGHWIRRALRGEEIGVVLGARLVAFRPVPIEAGDYLEREYGLSKVEADRAAAAIARNAKQAIAAGDYVTLNEALLQHAPVRHPLKNGRSKTRRTARS